MWHCYEMNEIQQRAVILFMVLQEKSAKAIHEELCVVLGSSYLAYATINPYLPKRLTLTFYPEFLLDHTGKKYLMKSVYNGIYRISLRFRCSGVHIYMELGCRGSTPLTHETSQLKLPSERVPHLRHEKQN